MNHNLLALRAQIDAIDKELLTTLNRRAALVTEAALVEQTAHGENECVACQPLGIARPPTTNSGPLSFCAINSIWHAINAACSRLAAPTRVAYLGPSGTFTEQAAIQYFGPHFGHVPCSSFEEIFRAATSGAADFGVVPIENSTEGVVARSLDLLLNSPLRIVGETSLLVRHQLLRKSGSLEGVEVVLAHPQALAQCQGWLSRHLPNADRRAVSSNADGARLATTNPTWASIASDRAADIFGLYIVAHDIHDDASNRTRFAVICLPGGRPPPSRSGTPSISLVVAVQNRPGAVLDLLTPLKRHGVSITRFESRPARSGQWEYFFYIDLQGSLAQTHVAAALAELQPQCAFYKVLGEYPVFLEYAES